MRARSSAEPRVVRPWAIPIRHPPPAARRRARRRADGMRGGRRAAHPSVAPAGRQLRRQAAPCPSPRPPACGWGCAMGGGRAASGCAMRPRAPARGRRARGAVAPGDTSGCPKSVGSGGNNAHPAPDARRPVPSAPATGRLGAAQIRAKFFQNSGQQRAGSHARENKIVL
jgi:hypothetical protein